jgi:hypothetical protein
VSGFSLSAIIVSRGLACGLLCDIVCIDKHNGAAEMTDKTGGPAFPIEGGHKFTSGNEVRKTLPHTGMTLRDYFAAKSMAAMIASNWPMHSVETEQHLAESAYRIAVAMLAERAK